jgi:peptide-methionine (S)-S-oxide reductase
MNQNKSDTPSGSIEVATLGGGCFWCTEAVFTRLQGVVKVESGYAGGSIENPTYEQVSTGRTGHAEAVQVTFDPRVVSFMELLEIFFATHDPTTLNRQGADVGTQYRSAIFYHSNEQRETAEGLIEELNSEKIWRNPVVTQIAPFTAFYRAEDSHMNYYEQHGNQPYCRLVIDPKLEKLRKRFKDHLKK